LSDQEINGYEITAAGKTATYPRDKGGRQKREI